MLSRYADSILRPGVFIAADGDRVVGVINVRDGKGGLALISEPALVEDYRPDATISYLSPQIEEILGYPIEAWEQQGFWLGVIHPDDRVVVRDDRLRDHRGAPVVGCGEPDERGGDRPQRGRRRRRGAVGGLGRAGHHICADHRNVRPVLGRAAR